MILPFDQVPVDYSCAVQRIETTTQDDRAKSRLRDDLIPISRVERQKVTTAFVMNVIDQLFEEIKKNGHYFNKTSFGHLLNTFAKVADEVLKLKPTKVCVQVTTTPGLYLNAEIDGEHLHIDLNFSEVNGDFEEAVVNVFSGKSQKLNVFGSIEEVFSIVRNYFEPDATYEYFIYTAYALPGQTYSPY